MLHGTTAILFPRRAVAIIDQLRDLLARRDDTVAARHDAVVQSLEDILFAEALVPTGHKRNAAQTRGNNTRSMRRAAESVNYLASALARQSRQNEGIAQASRAGLLLETSSGTNSPPAAVTSATRRPARDTTMARWPAPDKDAHQFDRAGIGGAAIERRHDDEHSDRSVRAR